ncbi:TolC family protein [Agitococcus lubricus]|uniref:Protein CyaE n=1 Tax=Agitococcus lubricus TaxID=1077255 RepID=A0A2T5IW98_9GAMM|nr:TolC family protein [Agitococcus lubricus]PTQ88161.1 outer membrane protein TolC [Agitococcus lubricus]
MTKRSPFYWIGLSMMILVTHQANAAQDCQAVLTSPLSLESAVNYGLCHHPQSQHVWAQLAVQKAGLAISQDSNKPALSLQASTANTWQAGDSQSSMSLQAQLNYLLFDFGERKASQQQARYLLDAAQLMLDTTIQSLSKDIVTAYLAVLKVQAQIDAKQRAVTAAQQTYRDAEARYQVGSGTPLEVVQAKAALAQTQLVLIQTQSQLANSRGALALAIGLSPPKLPALSPITNLYTPNSLTEQQLSQWLQQSQQHSDIRIEQANLEAAKQAVLTARSANKPSVSLSANSGWQDRDGSAQDSTGLALNLTVPLDIGGAKQARIQQALAKQQAQEASLLASQQQVEQTVWQAFYELQAAVATIHAAQESVASSDKALKVALARYQMGLSTMLDVLNAQSVLANSQLQQVNAQYDGLTARVALSYRLGESLQPTIQQFSTEPSAP